MTALVAVMTALVAVLMCLWRSTRSIVAIQLNTRFLRGFFAYKKLLGLTEMQKRERKEWQSIWTVSDISRDDRARIATCSLRTATDRFKEDYSIDVEYMHAPALTCIRWSVASWFCFADSGRWTVQDRRQTHSWWRRRLRGTLSVRSCRSKPHTWSAALEVETQKS